MGRWFRSLHTWGEMVSVFTKLTLYVNPARIMICFRYSLNKDISEKKNTFNPYQCGDVWITRFIWPHLYSVPTWGEFDSAGLPGAKLLWNSGACLYEIILKLVFSKLLCSQLFLFAVAVLGCTERGHMDGPSFHISMQLLRFSPPAYSVNSPQVFCCVRSDDHMIFLRIYRLVALVNTWQG
jgi:hypothetical protein